MRRIALSPRVLDLIIMASLRVAFGIAVLSIWIFALKTLGKLLSFVGIRLFALDADYLVSEMERKYGRKISLAQDPVWMNGLRLVVSRTNEECPRSQVFGRWTRKSYLTSFILQPLLITEAAVSRNPAVLDVRVNRPIFITGTGRNGSTLLQFLMAKYPNVRYLTIPDATDPVSLDTAREFDPRWRHERQRLWTESMSVSQSALCDLRLYSHSTSASDPEECALFLSRYLFWFPLLTFNGPCEGVSWSLSQPEFTRQAYEMFRRDLQLILYYDEKADGIRISNQRFVLKMRLSYSFPCSNQKSIS